MLVQHSAARLDGDPMGLAQGLTQSPGQHCCSFTGAAAASAVAKLVQTLLEPSSSPCFRTEFCSQEDVTTFLDFQFFLLANLFLPALVPISGRLLICLENKPGSLC